MVGPEYAVKVGGGGEGGGRERWQVEVVRSRLVVAKGRWERETTRSQSLLDNKVGGSAQDLQEPFTSEVDEKRLVYNLDDELINQQGKGKAKQQKKTSEKIVDESFARRDSDHGHILSDSIQQGNGKA
ncbi:uncharacterized protein A4U43_C01F22690 [Asparagus officinalis]|uniref:Uncharacterized protein n=1 Tax=Asparagus officinalis TaxID=4686 RepID=A0A5P1FRZ7_ASPOF|nr:uncharacterized protein A4U43_C01F22690 [Asparagus officinalis]